MTKIISHWGVLVNSDTPITGVVSNNQAVQFIADECMDGIDLDYEDQNRTPFHEDENTYEQLEYNPDNRTNWLIGDWIKDSDGLYTHDPNGEYAAIVREVYTQVVFSQHIRRSNLCSPCYPGQGDLESDGDYLAYDLPLEAYLD